MNLNRKQKKLRNHSSCSTRRFKYSESATFLRRDSPNVSDAPAKKCEELKPVPLPTCDCRRSVDLNLTPRSRLSQLTRHFQSRRQDFTGCREVWSTACTIRKIRALLADYSSQGFCQLRVAMWATPRLILFCYRKVPDDHIEDHSTKLRSSLITAGCIVVLQLGAADVR